MKNLIIDAATDKILFKIIVDNKSYTSDYPNCRENFDKFVMLLFNFLKENKIKLKEINTKLAYEDYDCCLSVRNDTELLEILKDKKQWYSKFSNYDKFISDFFYILDGESSERIRGVIQKVR